MKLAIVGSRDYPNLSLVRQFVRSLPSDWTIVSGGAWGVDQTAESEARARKMEVEIFKPDWELHGKSAGMVRNGDIVRAADVVVAFHHEKSKGTANTILRAKTAGKPCHIITCLVDMQNTQKALLSC